MILDDGCGYEGPINLPDGAWQIRGWVLRGDLARVGSPAGRRRGMGPSITVFTTLPQAGLKPASTVTLLLVGTSVRANGAGRPTAAAGRLGVRCRADYVALR